MTEMRINYSLGEYRNAAHSALVKLRKDNLIERIWKKDYTVWKPAPDEIVNRLGWLDAPAETLAKLNYIRTVIKPLTDGNISDVVLLGMGGSSLAAEVFSSIFGGTAGYPRLHTTDTTDPVLISQLTQSLDLEKTFFLVSSKSGTTLETISLFKYFYNKAFQKSGRDTGKMFAFITDGGSPLIKIAENISAYHIFLSNHDIGGRYSALSLPGIVPAAVIGVDVEKILKSAMDASQAEKQNYQGAFLGATLGVLALVRRDKPTFILPPRWKAFGNWLEQLIAESAGKEGKGFLPVLDEPLADPRVYGKDRLFIFFQDKQEKNKNTAALVQAGHPVIIIRIDDDYDLGGQMYIWEMATAVSGHILSINPFDQPGVETAKKNTLSIIAKYREKKEFQAGKAALTTDQCDVYGTGSSSTPAEALKNFLGQAAAFNYVCLQIYLSPTPEVNEALQKLRETIFTKYGIAVTIGYGPRYLHSTGQLHKGDSGNGLFIQLTEVNSLDVDIPDDIGKERSSSTFGTLKAAQAQGDMRALSDIGRRIIRFHFRINPADGLKNLSDLL
ncbi:MAG: hypothetical protein JW976_11435 [Syntrophaceae bacterium]|nr:hypothetical protein [Syntrophaceae bacterium]